MMSEMEFEELQNASTHIENLTKFCRVCGSLQKRKSRAYCPVAPYRNELISLFKIDIQYDDKSIHPNKICNSCRSKCFYFRTNKAQGKIFSIKIPVKHLYTSHRSNCTVCHRTPGRNAAPEFFNFSYNPSSTVSDSEEKPKQVEPADSSSTESECEDHEKKDEPPHSFQSTACLDSHAAPSTSRDPPSTSCGSSESLSFSDSHEEPPVKKMCPGKGILNVKKQLDFESTSTLHIPAFFSSTGEYLSSIPIERAVEHSLAKIFQCTVCLGLPTDAVTTPCKHIFCRSCISTWLTNSCACPVCREPVELNEINILKGQLALMYDILHVTCRFSNCESVMGLNEIVAHENKCKYGKYPSKLLLPSSSAKRGEGLQKMPIYDCKAKYVKQKRLKQIENSMEEFCSSKKEDKTDVLFFMLIHHLKSINDNRHEQINDIWGGGGFRKLTSHECLAIRIDTLQSKTQYKCQYDFLKSKGCNPFATPYALDEIECQYVPGSVRYSLEGQDHISNYYHTPVKPSRFHTNSPLDNSFEPLDITEDFPQCVPELATPNVKGCRWRYPDAVAKTLHELERDIVSGLELQNIDPYDPTILLKTYIKDGADGLGDVSVHKEVGDRYLPDKAFRFSFCVYKIEALLEDERKITIFVENRPNSVKTNRPLLEAICDENNHGSSTLCLLPIENERSYMKDKVIRIQTDCGWRRHVLIFSNSMIDEKLDRANSGFAGSGSNYLCTLCDATRETALSNLGNFVINRSFAETTEIGEYIRINPDNLSKSDLNKISKGVKSTPILQAEAAEKGLDATHADINCGSFFRKLLIREVAQINKWDMTEDVKSIIKNAEVKLDLHLKKTIGINPQLMMPGNYARAIFDPKNENFVLHLIEDDDRKSKVRELLEKFRFMRMIYRAIDPKAQYPTETKLYKQTAVAFGKTLIEHFEYAKWPNYIHKIIEHVQELIENDNGPGTVGGLSSEGNEGGNKIFRHFRKNLARKGSTYGGIRDVLWGHWLYSSPSLTRLSSKSKSEQRCSSCKCFGHNIRNCPSRM